MSSLDSRNEGHAKGFATDGRSESVSLVGLAMVLLRYRHVILILALIGGALGTIDAVAATRTYTADASFLPQSRRSPSALSGLASQLALALPAEDASQSPQFYVDLVLSRDLLGQLVDTRFHISDRPETLATPLVDLMKVKGATPEIRHAAAIASLRSTVTAQAAVRTGVVSFRVTTHDPRLSKDIADSAIAHLNRFNIDNRQSQAAAERRFVEARLVDVQQELTDAETALEAFLRQNRDYANSPELRFEEDRLARRIQQRQQVYSSLAQAAEQSKIEQVRDTPLITVVTHPVEPLRPDSNRWRTKALLGMILAGGLGIFFAFVADGIRRVRASRSPELDELVAIVSTTRFARMLRRVRESH
jgi:uncharacterized protein involved in exopolysaccharide biosynthesis